MNKHDKIYIAGHAGMVGSAVERHLRHAGYSNIITSSSAETDLTNTECTEDFFRLHQPDYVFLAAAKVGGIKANTEFPAEFILQNLRIQTNVIHSSYRYGIKKLLFFGSSCIYPNNIKQPITEDHLLAGKPEPTNLSYAIAKIAGIEMCKAYRKQYGCNFISCMPCNLYGPNDNYDASSSHVMAALIRKIIQAKKNNNNAVIVWGSGKPLREFLHVDDLAAASLLLMKHYNEEEIINVGSGVDISVHDLAIMICDIINYKGKIVFDKNQPDGTYRKVLDVSKLKSMGWQPTIDLRSGVASACQSYVHQALFESA